MNPPADTRKVLFRSMLRIRRVQERIDAEYLHDRMKTPVHLCIGQEAIAVGVCAALRKDDYIQSNHRSHGHYLAKGGDLKKLIAELHCRTTGCSRGHGGSMHLVDVSVGHLGSSSIVGGGIPIGVGLGLAAKMRGEDKVSVTFFGDGAADEGILYESVNFAMLKRLPVIFVLEDNKWAVCSHRNSRQCQDNVFLRGADPDLLFAVKIDGNDLSAIHAKAQASVERARSGRGPSFMICDTYRIPGHAGCRKQDPEGYRDTGEIEKWWKKCPVDTERRILLESGLMSEHELGEMEAEIRAEIEEAFQFALSSPLPTAGDLHKHLFRE